MTKAELITFLKANGWTAWETGGTIDIVGGYTHPTLGYGFNVLIEYLKDGETLTDAEKRFWGGTGKWNGEAPWPIRTMADAQQMVDFYKTFTFPPYN